MSRALADLGDVVRTSLGDGPWVVALGGGADSAALLGACVSARETGVRAVFVNHGLEGSASLGEHARRLSEQCGVSLTVIDAVVIDGPDLESRARFARYRAIESVLVAGEVCATAHTSDDQAETVLMRLARGSGSTGLAGIPEARGPFRRPFLGVSRAELRIIALDENLPFTDDPANADERFLRTRIRSTVLPVLEQEVGPEIRGNLAASATLIGDDDRLLGEAAQVIPVVRATAMGGATVSVPVGPLITSLAPIATRAVREALLAFHAPYRGSQTDVAAVLATAADGVQRNLSADVMCIVEQGMVVLASKQAVESPPDVDISVGERVEWGSCMYNVYRSDRPALASTVGRRTAIADTGAAMRFVAVTDGDKIEIEGGTARVVEILRSAGVPVRMRPFWLAVTINGKIAAIHGIRVASWARPTPGEPAIIIEREGSL